MTGDEAKQREAVWNEFVQTLQPIVDKMDAEAKERVRKVMDVWHRTFDAALDEIGSIYEPEIETKWNEETKRIETEIRFRVTPPWWNEYLGRTE